jgi:hypothetical protein
LINTNRADHATPAHQLMDGFGFIKPHAAMSSVTTGRPAPASAEARRRRRSPIILVVS